MASSSLDPVTGAPRFLDADAPDPAVNPTEVAAFAAKVGTRLIGTTAERDAYPYKREGLEWYNTTKDLVEVYNGTGWVADTQFHVTGGKDGLAAPVGASIIVKAHAFSGQLNGSGAINHNFPTAFPTHCAVVFPTTVFGSSAPTVINNDQISKTGANFVVPGSGNLIVGISYLAIGW